MENKDDIIHLEQLVSRLQKHITQQDQEIFKLSKRVDSLIRQLDKLEKRVNDSNAESPILENADPVSERPPHY